MYAARVHGLESRCFDIAPDAEAATAHNARVNGVGDLVTFVADQALIEDGWARIVAANIGAAALVALQPSLLRMVAPGGAVFLGGIRSHQVDDVLAAFGPAGVSSVETIDGWCTVTVSPSPTLTRTMRLTEGAGAE